MEFFGFPQKIVTCTAAYIHGSNNTPQPHYALNLYVTHQVQYSTYKVSYLYIVSKASTKQLWNGRIFCRDFPCHTTLSWYATYVQQQTFVTANTHNHKHTHAHLCVQLTLLDTRCLQNEQKMKRAFLCSCKVSVYVCSNMYVWRQSTTQLSRQSKYTINTTPTTHQGTQAHT